eukprot:CAMPEP_0175872912 /NCGR_PEP_ID=MMETSP0107_2-20121207/38006_1 /TAXON_ID=195067 ORGANISM="Goniomonas pacifica, Strain CCMP1869" /NCGR_SAMPLE_ID=MMETSP0107_2 /ASSEMBLY_ACC=CAM_ASM_000203 /LENGTH=124 /DNA_ID=CAMNT_0017191559 /DNA_START=973 /DNA_END=1344 /DNA_ORIENTATION=+
MAQRLLPEVRTSWLPTGSLCSLGRDVSNAPPAQHVTPQSIQAILEARRLSDTSRSSRTMFYIPQMPPSPLGVLVALQGKGQGTVAMQTIGGAISDPLTPSIVGAFGRTLARRSMCSNWSRRTPV